MSTGCGWSSAFAAAASQAKVGAIRWDAWYDDSGPVGQTVEATLAPEKYHYRLPFFAQVLGPTQVRINGTSQEIMDQEIDDASHAGISYWAYCLYAENDPMSDGLKHYLASSKRQRIKFSLITTPDHYVVAAMTARIETLLTDENSLRVLDGRPVLFIGFITEQEIKDYFGGNAGRFREGLDRVRTYCVDHGLKTPYVVVMDFDPHAGKKWLDLLGADALTSYTTAGNTEYLADQPTPFADLSKGVEWFWDQCQATGAAVVPIIVTGGDRRPRIEHPVPWEKDQKVGVGMDRYVGPATPGEIAAQTRDALQWLKVHAASADAQLALIYAWDENDEGGWLIPTLGEGRTRLDALTKVLKEEGDEGPTQ